MFPQTVDLTNNQTVTIREAEKADAAAIIDCLNTIGGETNYLTFGAEEYDMLVSAQKNLIAVSKSRPNALILVAEIDTRLVGLLTFEGGPKDRVQHTGEFGISILQEYWGAGIGSGLTKLLIEWARQTGIIRKINLKVHENNHRAIKMYQMLDFEQEGKISREYSIDGQFYANILMGLTID